MVPEFDRGRSGLDEADEDRIAIRVAGLEAVTAPVFL